MIAALFTILTLGFAWMLVELWRAPVGYEDEAGFHLEPTAPSHPSPGESV